MNRDANFEDQFENPRRACQFRSLDEAIGNRPYRRLGAAWTARRRCCYVRLFGQVTAVRFAWFTCASGEAGEGGRVERVAVGDGHVSLHGHRGFDASGGRSIRRDAARCVGGRTTTWCGRRSRRTAGGCSSTPGMGCMRRSGQRGGRRWRRAASRRSGRCELAGADGGCTRVRRNCGMGTISVRR